MKKIVMFAILAFVSTSAHATDFCDGYQDGFKEGWCDGKYSCLAPIPPACPMPNFGETTYKSGYNRGFKDGFRQQSQTHRGFLGK